MKTIEEFKEYFKDDPKLSKTMYRLSAYMWSLKNDLGAIVKSYKNGRAVVGYQLINPQHFNELGKPIRKNKNVSVS